MNLLFRDITYNCEPSIDLATVKARLQDTAFRSYSSIDKDTFLPTNVSKDEYES